MSDSRGKVTGRLLDRRCGRPTLHQSKQILASNLKRARRAKGWTQRQLAAAAAVRQATVSGIERADANPVFDTLHGIAEALGIAVGELVAAD